MGVLIVGASTAGVRTAQLLRRQGWTSSITVIGEESHLPYDKPPLSKQMLSRAAPTAPPPLLSQAEFDELEIDLRLSTQATSLDIERQVVALADAQTVEFDQLVIATGLVPRTLPGAEALAGIYTIRHANDSGALRAELRTAGRVVVIGAGFIGAEFASAARAQGARVDIVETQDVPMAHLFGAEVGRRLARLHEVNEVSVHTGVAFDRFTGRDRVTGVGLTDGRVLPADLVVVGVGARPATDWLQSSGLPIDNGVLCEVDLRVVGTEAIYAAGDIARRPHPSYPSSVRIEHWTNANEHAATVASSLTGKPMPAAQPPYVWSDQYGEQIQVVGRPGAGRPRVLRDGSPVHGLTVAYTDADDVVVAAVVVGDPRALMQLRKAVARGTTLAELDLPFAVIPA